MYVRHSRYECSNTRQGTRDRDPLPRENLGLSVLSVTTHETSGNYTARRDESSGTAGENCKEETV